MGPNELESTTVNHMNRRLYMKVDLRIAIVKKQVFPQVYILLSKRQIETKMPYQFTMTMKGQVVLILKARRTRGIQAAI